MYIRSEIAIVRKVRPSHAHQLCRARLSASALCHLPPGGRLHHAPRGRVLQGHRRRRHRPFYDDADRQLRLASDTSWIDFDKLADFPEWAADLLDENPSMYGRTDFIYEGLQKRIDFLQLLFG